MSNGSTQDYKLEYSDLAEKNINDLHSIAKHAGKGVHFVHAVIKAVNLMRTNPHGWGDPVYRAKTVDAVLCRGIVDLLFSATLFTNKLGRSCFWI
jgi:tetrahydromethanopterin S-methyltransferase subunit D